MLARAIATQFAADRRGSTSKSRGDFLLIGPLVTQLRYVITFLDCQGLRIKFGVFQHVQQVVRVEGGFHPFGFGAVLGGFVLS
jgi:hypothetical protein